MKVTIESPLTDISVEITCKKCRNRIGFFYKIGQFDKELITVVDYEKILESLKPCQHCEIKNTDENKQKVQQNITNYNDFIFSLHASNEETT